MLTIQTQTNYISNNFECSTYPKNIYFWLLKIQLCQHENKLHLKINSYIYIYIKVAFKHLIIFHNSITILVYL